MIIGTPVAKHKQQFRRTEIGSLSYIESRKYNLNNYDSLESYTACAAQVTDDAPLIIVNLDRVIGYKSKEHYQLIPSTLDPLYSKYDLVLNVLAGIGDRMVIDIKWNHDLYSSETIEIILNRVHSTLAFNYATA